MTTPRVYPMPAVESLANIPEKFTRRPQWVNYRLEERKGKTTKVPYNPRTGYKASSTDLLTWSTFETVRGALDRFDGVGFVFCSGDPFIGVDLDDCRNVETGEIEAWAQKIIDSFEGAYIEASPSGTGVHIIGVGVQRQGTKRGSVEVYSQERFFTVTGEVL